MSAVAIVVALFVLAVVVGYFYNKSQSPPPPPTPSPPSTTASSSPPPTNDEDDPNAIGRASKTAFEADSTFPKVDCTDDHKVRTTTANGTETIDPEKICNLKRCESNKITNYAVDGTKFLTEQPCEIQKCEANQIVQYSADGGRTPMPNKMCDFETCDLKSHTRVSYLTNGTETPHPEKPCGTQTCENNFVVQYDLDGSQKITDLPCGVQRCEGNRVVKYDTNGSRVELDQPCDLQTCESNRVVNYAIDGSRTVASDRFCNLQRCESNRVAEYATDGTRSVNPYKICNLQRCEFNQIVNYGADGTPVVDTSKICNLQTCESNQVIRYNSDGTRVPTNQPCSLERCESNRITNYAVDGTRTENPNKLCNIQTCESNQVINYSSNGTRIVDEDKICNVQQCESNRMVNYESDGKRVTPTPIQNCNTIMCENNQLYFYTSTGERKLVQNSKCNKKECILSAGILQVDAKTGPLEISPVTLELPSGNQMVSYDANGIPTIIPNSICGTRRCEDNVVAQYSKIDGTRLVVADSKCNLNACEGNKVVSYNANGERTEVAGSKCNTQECISTPTTLNVNSLSGPSLLNVDANQIVSYNNFGDASIKPDTFCSLVRCEKAGDGVSRVVTYSPSGVRQVVANSLCDVQECNTTDATKTYNVKSIDPISKTTVMDTTVTVPPNRAVYFEPPFGVPTINMKTFCSLRTCENNQLVDYSAQGTRTAIPNSKCGTQECKPTAGTVTVNVYGGETASVQHGANQVVRYSNAGIPTVPPDSFCNLKRCESNRVVLYNAEGNRQEYNRPCDTKLCIQNKVSTFDSSGNQAVDPDSICSLQTCESNVLVNYGLDGTRVTTNSMCNASVYQLLKTTTDLWIDANDPTTLSTRDLASPPSLPFITFSSPPKQVLEIQDKSPDPKIVGISGSAVYFEESIKAIRMVGTAGSGSSFAARLDLRKSQTQFCTIMIVYKLNSPLTNPFATGALWGCDVAGGWNRFQLLNQGLTPFVISTGGTTPNFARCNALRTNDRILYVAEYSLNSANSSYIYVNGQRVTSFTETNAIQEPNAPMIFFGSVDGKNHLTNIEFNEIICFRRRLSRQSRQSIEAYLALKWSIASTPIAALMRYQNQPLSSYPVQFVQIRQNTPKIFLNIADVKIHVGGSEVRIPAGATVTAITNEYDENCGENPTYPWRNILNGNANDFGHSNAAINTPAVIEINFGSSLNLSSFILVNRNDCCRGRIVGSIVRFLDPKRRVLFESDPIPGLSNSYVPDDGASILNANLNFVVAFPTTTSPGDVNGSGGVETNTNAKSWWNLSLTKEASPSSTSSRSSSDEGPLPQIRPRPAQKLIENPELR